MTDLEAVAKLLGEGKCFFRGDGDKLIRYPETVCSDWGLAGACLEKMAEMGTEPMLECMTLKTGEKVFECIAVMPDETSVVKHEATWPAAIIACAAAVSRQRSGE